MLLAIPADDDSQYHVPVEGRQTAGSVPWSPSKSGAGVVANVNGLMTAEISAVGSLIMLSAV